MELYSGVVRMFSRSVLKGMKRYCEYRLLDLLTVLTVGIKGSGVGDSRRAYYKCIVS